MNRSAHRSHATSSRPPVRRTPLRTLAALAALTVASQGARGQCRQSTDQLDLARSHIEATTSVGDCVLFGGGWTGTATTARVSIYDTVSGTWSSIDFPSTVARQQGNATTVAGRALFAGGITGGGSTTETDQVDIYDSALGAPDDPAAWSAAHLSRKRRNLAAASLGQWAMFAGGQDNSAVVDDLDVYDATTGLWTDLALPGGPRLGIRGTAVGPYVLFAGGWNGDGMTVVDVYDANVGPASDPAAWSSVDALSTPRYAHSAVTVGTTAIFAGGLTDNVGPTTASVDIYDSSVGPPSDPAAWSTATLSTARVSMVAAVADGRAVFAGGRLTVDGAAVGTVDIYDAVCDTWTTDTLAVARANGGAAAGSGRIVVAGGYSGTPGTPVPRAEVDVFTCGCGHDCAADANGDGVVDVNDLVEVIQSWGECP